MPEIDDGKYITFKRSEFYGEVREAIDRILGGESIDAEMMIQAIEGLEINDAVVIRLQDWFAEAGLYAYSNAVRMGFELLEGTRTPSPATEHLEDVADYFARKAHEAHEHPDRKLPD